MSIITKALKKAQEKRTGKESKKKTLPGSAPRADAAGQKKILFRGLLPFAAAILILGISAGFLLYNNRPSAAPTPASTAAKKPISAPAERKIPPADTEAAPGRRESRLYGAANTSEETADTSPAMKKANSFGMAKNLPVLTGIMYSPTLPQAIINGAVISEGEVVDGFLVLKILPGSVRFISGKEEFELELR